jgi:hypothetical protein
VALPRCGAIFPSYEQPHRVVLRDFHVLEQLFERSLQPIDGVRSGPDGTPVLQVRRVYPFSERSGRSLDRALPIRDITVPRGQPSDELKNARDLAQPPR